MVPSRLKRHLEGKHDSVAHTGKNFLLHLKAQNAKKSNFMQDFSTISNKALEASYAVAKIIAKTKQPHTIAESLVLPCCREIVKIMINESAVEEVENVPLSSFCIAIT